MKKIIALYQTFINQLKRLDFIGLLALRIYLAPIFIIAGLAKLNSFNDTAQWLGNSEWGLGLPFPALMTALVILAELVGGFALLFGLLTRFFSILLIITMAVAGFAVHLKNGWFAIASSDEATSIASFWANVGFSSAQNSVTNAQEVAQRLDKAKEILQTHGNYDWLTEYGNFVILNNGMEFAITYLIMLLPLLFYGAGNYVSLDYYLNKFLNKK
ncbi:HvfX family Cu-binding RiPP maturation protein [Moraxella nasicaprae]|uniref:DoxX family protein n=1 Tax=Moraxella nasicaprae TaxID=2904122 RepID=A0ABY6F636_9GAMM|nr:DoxX family protein [Moraxella nasicaprae]UXZ05571.1 DoxX family protein [Moraxella nasicaprae]